MLFIVEQKLGFYLHGKDKIWAFSFVLLLLGFLILFCFCRVKARRRVAFALWVLPAERNHSWGSIPRTELSFATGGVQAARPAVIGVQLNLDIDILRFSINDLIYTWAETLIALV